MRWPGWPGRGGGRGEFAGGPPAPERAFCAIGDIHGRDDLLVQMLAVLESEAPGVPRVFVGDYVDRGDDAAEVLRRLKRLSETDGAICLRGNHEEMLLDFAHGGYPRWLLFGGLQTLASFGLGAGLTQEGGPGLEAAQDGLRRALEAEGLLGWLEDLPRYWESGNVTVSHAGADPGRPIAAQRHALTSGHPDFFRQARADGRWIVHGHYLRDHPEEAPGRIGIDTGAYASGRLTAAIIAPGEAVRYVTAQAGGEGLALQ